MLKVPSEILAVLVQKWNVHANWLLTGLGSMFTPKEQSAPTARPQSPLELKRQFIIDMLRLPYVKANDLDKIQHFVEYTISQSQAEKESPAEKTA
jgi:hypothetical protein